MSDLRSKLIRLAHSMPKGSEERTALLEVLAASSKDLAFAARIMDDYEPIPGGEILQQMSMDVARGRISPRDLKQVIGVFERFLRSGEAGPADKQDINKALRILQTLL